MLCMLWDGSPGAFAASFRVGSFTKTTAAAPTSQVVPHGLGEVPKALIVWTDGHSSDDVWSEDVHRSFGVTDGTSAYAASFAITNNRSPSSTWKRQTAALVSIFYPGSVLAEATLGGWDDTAFTLNWAINDPAPTLLHFIAIGGSEVSAKALTWVLPTTPGSIGISGVGFQPDVVLHVMTDHESTTMPTFVGRASWGLGAMDKFGNQWVLQIRDANSANPTSAMRAQLTTASLMQVSTSTIPMVASFQSMDPDGFTLDVTQTTGSAGIYVALALRGLAAHVGSFLKSTAAAPASQTVSGIGFTPSLVLLASAQNTASPTVISDARSGIGAMDGVRVASSASQSLSGVSTSVVYSVDSSSAAFIKSDNSTGNTDARAESGGFAPGAFTLSWPVNDATPTQLAYLALGEAVPIVPDAGDQMPPDAGDGGPEDAGEHGPADGGPATANDGGLSIPTDVGPPLRSGYHVGCDCSTSSVPAAMAWLFAVMLIAAVRPRRASRRNEQ